MRKVLLIGIDGATWDIIDPMMEEGRLPNFRRLKEEGAWGRLESLDPPLTPIVWTSIASGKRKEKHGILDFFSTSQDIETKRIWDVLEERGYTIGLHEYPVTWPPKECNGFVIPDLFARDISTYPEELGFVKGLAIAEKNRQTPGLRSLATYYQVLRHGITLNTLWKALKYLIGREALNFSYLDDFHTVRMVKLSLYGDIFVHLYKRYQPDFAVTYFNQPDALGHLFWKYMDPEGFGDVPEKDIERYGDVIKDSYEAIDEQVGRLLQCVSNDTLVVLLSDHGFGKALVNSHGRKLSIRVEALMDFLEFPGDVVGVNVHKSTYYRSTASTEKERADSRSEILAKLQDVRLLESNHRVFEVFGRGEYVIVEPLTDIDIPPEVRVWADGRACPYQDLIQDTSTRFSGDHREYGILMLRGKHIKPGYEIRRASVLDVAPTILAALGVPVGRDMDGRALTEAFNPLWDRSSLTYIDSHDVGEPSSEGYTETDLEPLKDRLRGLGYL